MRPAKVVSQFGESIIREMTRVAIQHGAINLSQGYPDFDPDPTVVQAAVNAITGGVNQYTITWGYPALRQKLAEIYTQQLGWPVNPDVHVTVTCGVTEGIVAAQHALLDPGDELLVIEPAHENFRPAAMMVGAKAVAVPLEAPGYRLDKARLAAAITPRTRAIVLNTPHNPTGRVFDTEEIQGLTELVLQHDLVLITDEIYNQILYDGRVHVAPGSLEPLRDRTVTVGGMSKTFAITGWRLGYVITPDPLAAAVRRVHDYTTICAPTPLQAAAVTALNLPASYYANMTRDYHQRRDVMMGYLEENGFIANLPEGAYYTMADFSQLDIPQAAWDDVEFALWMTKEIGVAVVPGSKFYSTPGHGTKHVRFAFPKRLETLHEAGKRLARMHQLPRS
ncbi:MAG: pyridoxal phosphate-dependent aminotransferase [Caldilineaceae bacterium]|nr:pyridoxal phosphate-dependent aminotransferase [Caldilineaceae bacterium]